MPRDNRCMYMAHVCFMSVVVNVWGSVGMFFCVAVVVKYIVVLALKCLSMLYVCVRSVLDVVFSVCIVTRGAVGARIWEV